MAKFELNLYGMIFGDPCLVIGCIHSYDHDGKHEFEDKEENTSIEHTCRELFPCGACDREFSQKKK